MSSQRRRVVLCIGLHCKANGDTDAFFKQLENALGYPHLFNQPNPRIKWEVAGCLKHCESGANLAIYPEGRFFHHLNPAQLAHIIQEEIAPYLTKPEE